MGVSQLSDTPITQKRYLQDKTKTVYWPITAWDAVIGLDSHLSAWTTANGTLIYNAVKDLIGTISGQPGADGKSAYELAVANGFSGTEAEWLTSLKGATGPAGAFKFIDNRGKNLTPAQYNSTYPKQIIEELYNTTDLGITLLPGQSSGLTVVETIIPWNDSTVGYPIQRAFPTSSARPLMYIRKGTGDTAWSAWELMTTW